MGFAVGMRAGTGPGAGAGRRPASGVLPFERQSPGRRVRPGGLEGEQTCTGLSPRGLHSILRFRCGVSPLPHVTRCPQAYSVSGSTPCLFCHSGGGAVTGQPGVGEGNLGSEEGRGARAPDPRSRHLGTSSGPDSSGYSLSPLRRPLSPRPWVLHPRPAPPQPLRRAALCLPGSRPRLMAVLLGYTGRWHRVCPVKAASGPVS